jgi:hypothetical protein
MGSRCLCTTNVAVVATSDPYWFPFFKTCEKPILPDEDVMTVSSKAKSKTRPFESVKKLSIRVRLWTSLIKTAFLNYVC